jgi:hypothetical protein
LVFGEPYINTDLNTLLLGGNGTQIQLLNISGGISASLIPQSTNAFDLGSATNIWRDLYISTGSIKFVAGTTVVKEITLATFTGLESATGSINSLTASISPRLTNLETTSASVNISVSSLNSFSASENTKSSTLATYTGSIDTKFTAVAASTASLNTFTASLSTTSNVRFGSLGIGMAATGTSGRIDAANDIVAFSTSDIRLKENIVPIPNALDKISKISGNTYDWRVELKDVHGYEGNDVGVIAQEVEAVLPQLVQDRDNGYKAVKYDKLIALLIEGIKEQQIQIHSLTIEIEKLKESKGL